jgi:hypothetical protein
VTTAVDASLDRANERDSAHVSREGGDTVTKLLEVIAGLERKIDALQAAQEGRAAHSALTAEQVQIPERKPVSPTAVKVSVHYNLCAFFLTYWVVCGEAFGALSMILTGEAFGALSMILTCHHCFLLQGSAVHTSASTTRGSTVSINTAASTAAEDSAWREGAAEAFHLLVKAVVLMIMVFALCQGALWAQAYLQ